MADESVTLQEYLDPEGLPSDVNMRELRAAMGHPQIRRAFILARGEITDSCRLQNVDMESGSERIAMQVHELAGVEKGATRLVETMLKYMNGDE